VQAEARRLKRQNSREHTEESWEAYRAARNLKGRIIKRALQQGHREQVEKATGDPKEMWKLASSLQAKAARIIAGAYRSTSGPALDVELYLLPMAQQIWKKNAETVSRILSTHNITELVEFRFFRTRRCRRRQKPYMSPLEHIFRRLYQMRGPTIQRQEIILPYLTPPWWRGPITSIAADSRKATEEHDRELRSFPNNLHVHTDGSGISGHIGAAAVSPTTGHIRKAYMGTSDISTVYVGELQGIRNLSSE
jgi:hypothetical protein